MLVPILLNGKARGWAHASKTTLYVLQSAVRMAIKYILRVWLGEFPKIVAIRSNESRDSERGLFIRKTVIEILSSENAGRPRHSFRPVISSGFIVGVSRKLYTAKGRSENDLFCCCIV